MALFQQSTSSNLSVCSAFLPGLLWLLSVNAFAQNINELQNGRIVGYYASWNSSNLPYNQVEYSNLSDIIVAFGTPDANGSITYNSGIPFPQLVSDAHAAGVKVLISLGGAGSGAAFSAATQDSALRATLISSMISFLQVNRYDGVDIDWETPSNSAQTANLDSLIGEMREEFDKLDSSWLITMAVPASNYGGGDFDFVYLINKVDWFNIMCYDFVGSWSTYSGFDSPLYQTPNDPNQAGSDFTAIAYWLSRGTYYHNRQLVHVDIPKSKLVIGVPFYGDSFSAVGFYQRLTNSTVTNTRYSDIINNLNTGWTYHWYEPAREPYLMNSSNTQFITYEDTNSVRDKAEFAKRDSLGGIMIWELSQDVLSNGSQPLLEAITATMKSLTPIVRKPDEASDFALYNNYPNPFNPSTTINFSMPKEGLVRLTVYDVLGQEVRTLIDGRLSPGEHEVTFNADGLASGVYFSVLKEGTEVSVKKMVLLK